MLFDTLRSAIIIFSATFISCYQPSMERAIYKCDRGKCPDGLFCIDGKYCTARIPECVIGGIEIQPDIAVCIGTNPGSPQNCADGTSLANCSAKVTSQELCLGIGQCGYCCR